MSESESESLPAALWASFSPDGCTAFSPNYNLYPDPYMYLDRELTFFFKLETFGDLLFAIDHASQHKGCPQKAGLKIGLKLE